MPTYDFRCTSCGQVFEAFRSFAAGTDDVVCPEDGAEATRLFSPPLDMLIYGREPSYPTSSIGPPTYAPSGPPHTHGHGHSHGPGTAPHSH